MSGFVGRMIAKGYHHDVSGRHHVDEWAFTSAHLKPGTKKILVFCPTYVARGEYAIIRDTIEHLTAHICLANKEPDFDIEIMLMAGIQWKNDERSEAQRRIAALCEMTRRHPIAFGCFHFEGQGKVYSLNLALQYATNHNFDGFLIIDDDIRLGDRSLFWMAKRFTNSGCRGAFGASKKGLAKDMKSARLLARVKDIIKAPASYPHACCMLVAVNEMSEGFPVRYVSDDGYVCFKMLDPAQPNPFHKLSIVPEAVCWFMIGGPTGETLKRIRRIMLSHLILMADFPFSKGWYVWRNVLFHGFWPVGTFALQKTKKLTAARWFLQMIYCIWFVSVGIELIVRGVISKPLTSVEWAAFTKYHAPLDSQMAIN